MIVCSCNVLTDHQLRVILANTSRRPRMSQIYRCLGAEAQCGRCAHTIMRIMTEITNRTIGSITCRLDRIASAVPTREFPQALKENGFVDNVAITSISI